MILCDFIMGNVWKCCEMVQGTQYSMVFCVLYYGYRTCFSYHGLAVLGNMYVCVCVGLMDVITNKII